MAFPCKSIRHILAKIQRISIFTFLIRLKVLRGVNVFRQNSLQKNIQLKTLITFDRAMVLTSNLSFLARHFEINICIHKKPEFMLKIFLLSFRISKQNWYNISIIYRSKVTAILKNDLFLLILTFRLTDKIVYSFYVWLFNSPPKLFSWRKFTDVTIDTCIFCVFFLVIPLT